MPSLISLTTKKQSQAEGLEVGLGKHSCLIWESAGSPQSLGFCDHFWVIEDLLSALFILRAGLLSWFIFCFEPAGGSWRQSLVLQLHLLSFGSVAGVMM